MAVQRQAVLAIVLLVGACGLSAAAASLESTSTASTGFGPRESSLWRRQLRVEARQVRALLHAGVESATTDAAEGDAPPDTSHQRSYNWLKWTAAAVLLVEGLLGVLLPVLLKITVHAGWFLSLVNCFAGGVFFTFGVMHLAPDALEAQDAVGLTTPFPLAAFFIAVSFFIVFFLHRILAPALRLAPHLHSAYPDAAKGQLPASPENGVAKCGRCGADCRCADAGSQCGRNSNDCGCAGGVSAGGCGTGCQAGGCQCVHRKDGGATSSPDPEVPADGAANAASFGMTATTLASAVAPVNRRSPVPGRRSPRLLKAAALVPPILILLGILCHAVLEGLTIGLQRDYAGVVSAFVAMASHKWVESIAVAAAFVAAGSSLLAVIAFLIPFALGPLVGIAIGVSVSDTNNWVILVLFGLVAGLFIYVGSVGIVAEEFAKYEDPAFAATRPRGARFYMFAALFFGFVVVALLQLVPDD